VQSRPGQSRQRTRSYQFSLLTSRPAEEVLEEFANRRLPGIGLAERGHNYLILRPQQRRRYGAEIAVVLAAVIVLVDLILIAVTPVLIILLPLALVPAIPLLLDHRPDLAISAVPDEEAGGTRVTVHGLAAAELAAALDAGLGSLPRANPVRAPEPETARRAAG
jgi:hypothetical protein